MSPKGSNNAVIGKALENYNYKLNDTKNNC
jgi:hypothetical protein